MEFRSMFIKDSDGEKSATLTAFVLGFVIVNVKFFLSGTSIGGLEMTALSGGEYAAAIGALGSIYVLNKNTDPKKKAEAEKVSKNTNRRRK